MTFTQSILTVSILSLLFTCNQPEKADQDDPLVDSVAYADIDTQNHGLDTAEVIVEKENNYDSVPDSAFVIMYQYASGFSYDMKYATDDNFLKKTVYDCDHCLVRKEVADALVEANKTLTKQGLRIKFFDCYRPVSVQKQMWEIYPNDRYVANPYTTGSIHNRGGAVDITLVDLNDQELDMGTGFDHFGSEAHHAYANLPDVVLANRQLLKSTMEGHGFNAITSEWWHYNFKSARKYALSDFSVKCD